MHTVKIDGKDFTIMRREDVPGMPRMSTWTRLFVRPRDTSGGPTAQHDVPDTDGKFRTNGHCYDFTGDNG